MSGPQTEIPATHDTYPCGCKVWDVGTASLYLKPCDPAKLCLVQRLVQNLAGKNPKNRVILRYGVSDAK
jgi:hypothetical protein